MIDKLLNIDETLRVFKDLNGKTCVCYERGYIKDDIFLIGAVGRGENFDEAVIDYCNKISGKTLIFDVNGERKEVIVLI